MIRLLAVMLLASAACFAAARILIVTDLEGVGGVNDADEQLLPGQRRYLESRHILTGEVNAAVAGALAAGATEVVIWDGHDGSRTLSIDEIDERAKLIQGRPTPPTYYLSQKLYDGIFFIGQHAMAGAKNAVLAHSQSFSVKRITLNDKEVGEIGQVAAIAGYFDIPVIMLAGDQAACDEIRDLQPNAVTVPVKRLVGTKSALSLSHAEAQRQIQSAAYKAVQLVAQYRPWKIPGPIDLVFEFPNAPPKTYHGQTVLEAYESWLGGR